MSQHPNVILAVALKPDTLTLKVKRAILAERELTESQKRFDDERVAIGGQSYHVVAMEDDYDESNQIAADAGDVVLFDLVTYDYGDTIAWDDLRARAEALDAWAKAARERHACSSHRVFVTANYW